MKDIDTIKLLVKIPKFERHGFRMLNNLVTGQAFQLCFVDSSLFYSKIIDIPIKRKNLLSLEKFSKYMSSTMHSSFSGEISLTYLSTHSHTRMTI